MKPYERIKFLRKNILKLNQEEFSKKINISRSNLGNIETNKINLTDRVLSDICRAFHVNKKWVTTGIEPVFDGNSYSLDDEIAKLYVSLTDKNKMYLYGYIQRLLEEQQN